MALRSLRTGGIDCEVCRIPKWCCIGRSTVQSLELVVSADTEFGKTTAGK